MTTMPNKMRFDAAAVEYAPVEAAEDKQKKARFKMRAYTGGPMCVAFWDFPVVIDLAKTVVASQTIPVRLDHDPTKGVGHTNEIRISENEINAEGVFSRVNEYSNDVKNSALDGFPWKCSVGGSVNDVIRLEEGFRTVNGKRVEGPCYIVGFELNEISFVDRGADPQAVASVQANRKENAMEQNENKESVVAEETQQGNQTGEQKVNASSVIEPSKKESGEKAIAELNASFADNLERIVKIQNLADGTHPELVAQAIRENWSVEAFAVELLRAKTPNRAPAIHCHGTEPPSSKVLECIACTAGGISAQSREKYFDEKTLEAADKHAGMGVQRFCEMACGHDLPEFRNNSYEWLRAAFSTNTLSNVLSNSGNKMLLEGYNDVDNSWQRVCKIGAVRDFKANERYRVTAYDGYQLLAPGGQIQHGSIGEQKWEIQASTYAIAFGIDRQMIVNDDLGAILQLHYDLGIAAGESIAKTVWTRFLSNPTQTDNKTFFHANHSNKFTGSTTALSYSALTTAESNFMALKKPNGMPLMARPKILLCPSALGGLAETLVKSQTLNDGSTAPTGTANIHYGKFEVVSTPFLSDTNIHSNASSTAWYLLADPRRVTAFEIAFLNGKSTPTIESTEANFDTLGMRFRAFIDYGFREQDYRGAIQMTGA